MTTLTIMPMNTAHIAKACEIELLCFGKKWTPTDFQRELKNSDCRYFSLLKDGHLLGYIGYWQILEEAHITSVAIHPNFQRQGFAQALLCRMLKDCIEQGVQWVTLEVKETNVSAQKLYEKFGFSILGRRRNYYQADHRDALIMWTENICTPQYQHFLESVQCVAC